jgi:hypothetical protein
VFRLGENDSLTHNHWRPVKQHRNFLCIISVLLAGCANWLPRAETQQPSAFESFEAASIAFDKIVGYRTTVDEMRSLGFDLQAAANITVIPYPQLTLRLMPDPGVPFDALDPGIRDCILARHACQAYEFRLARETKRREGTFLLDFLNFKRTVHVVGWRFEGLVAVRNGVVLFRSHGGEPRNDRTERQVNPLGPLQPAGEAAGGLIRR